MKRICLLAILLANLVGCLKEDYPQEVDILIKGGQVYTGMDQQLMRADIGIIADSIVFVGENYTGIATAEIDATNFVVSPGIY